MINLTKFCSLYIERIRHPWSDGEFTFATNGHIIVRVSRRKEIPENNNAPDAIELWGFYSPADDVLCEIPELPKTKWEKCVFCNGRKKINRDICDECDGLGKIRVIQHSMVNGVFFDDEYLKLIKELPGHAFFVNKKWDRPHRFTFTGGEGFLMPMRDREVDE